MVPNTSHLTEVSKNGQTKHQTLVHWGLYMSRLPERQDTTNSASQTENLGVLSLIPLTDFLSVLLHGNSDGPLMVMKEQHLSQSLVLDL